MGELAASISYLYCSKIAMAHIQKTISNKRLGYQNGDASASIPSQRGADLILRSMRYVHHIQYSLSLPFSDVLANRPGLNSNNQMNRTLRTPAM